MIGDNLKTDILGANDRKDKSAISWISIAVKTGIFKGTDKEIKDSGVVPNYITDTFEDAIKLIFELEGIKYEYK